MMSSKLVKTKKNRKIPENFFSKKTKKTKKKKIYQQDQQINEVKKKDTMTKPEIFNLSNKV